MGTSTNHTAIEAHGMERCWDWGWEKLGLEMWIEYKNYGQRNQDGEQGDWDKE